MIELCNVTEADREGITAFYERYLNSGERVREEIASAFLGGAYFGVKAGCDGRVAGYFTLREGIVLTYPHPEAEAEMRDAADGRRVATVDALAVSDDFRRMGIAGRMAERNKELLRERGTELLAVEIWLYPDGSSPGKRIYEKMGSTIYKRELPDFYKDAHRYGLSCPICGDRCRCGAILEVIEL